LVSISSRVAESFYNLFDRKAYKTPSYFEHSLLSNPVVLLPDLTHLQFADGVNPPLVVKSLDLKPTISITEAHSRVSEVVGSFLEVQYQSLVSSGVSGGAAIKETALGKLREQVKATRAFLDPVRICMSLATVTLRCLIALSVNSPPSIHI
jgi:hypothetical protein